MGFMKKIVLMLMMAVAAISAHAQKYALVDMEYILRNIPAYERANEQLNQVSRKWQAEVEALNLEASTRARCGYRCRSGSDGSRGLRGLVQNGGHRETGKNMGIPCPASYIDCPSCPKRRCRFGAASWANTHTHSCHGTSVAE